MSEPRTDPRAEPPMHERETALKVGDWVKLGANTVVELTGTAVDHRGEYWCGGGGWVDPSSVIEVRRSSLPPGDAPQGEEPSVMGAGSYRQAMRDDELVRFALSSAVNTLEEAGCACQPEEVCALCLCREAVIHMLESQRSAFPGDAPQPYQQRVRAWAEECFGTAIADNRAERGFRFIEEALELGQSIGTTREQAIRLVEYVYGRPTGQTSQEIGGVMVTLRRRKVLRINGDTYEIVHDLIDVTCFQRPDTAWRWTDMAGHLHQWHDADGPAAVYKPGRSYTLPTLRYVIDGYAPTDDGGEIAYGHHECIKCRAHVTPRYTSDVTRQFIPGPRRALINGEPVTMDEFLDRLAAHGVFPVDNSSNLE